jgi:hypothetical protein
MIRPLIKIIRLAITKGVMVQVCNPTLDKKNEHELHEAGIPDPHESCMLRTKN